MRNRQITCPPETLNLTDFKEKNPAISAESVMIMKCYDVLIKEECEVAPG
jgi:hypothetical protein